MFFPEVPSQLTLFRLFFKSLLRNHLLREASPDYPFKLHPSPQALFLMVLIVFCLALSFSHLSLLASPNCASGLFCSQLHPRAENSTRHTEDSP